MDLHLDTSGHLDLDLAVDLLALRGRIILMAGLAQRPELPAGALYTRDAQIIGFVISNGSAVELAAAASLVNQLVADGTLTPRRVEELPLSAAADAHRRLETGHHSGARIVLRPETKSET